MEVVILVRGAVGVVDEQRQDPSPGDRAGGGWAAPAHSQTAVKVQFPRTGKMLDGAIERNGMFRPAHGT